MDSLVFRCPGCQQPFQVLAEQAGQMVRCPGCIEAVQIPVAAAQAQSPSKPSGVQPKPGAATNEVQSHDCPACKKAFGIYVSMFGAEMVCPHCQKTVLLRPISQSPPVITLPPVTKAAPNPKVRAKAEAKPKSSRPSKSPPKTKPKVALQQKLEKAKSIKPSVSETDAHRVKQESVAPLPGPVVADSTEQTPVGKTENLTEASVEVFVPQPVDHLLPPKFLAVDPAFFYRRHQDGSQVLLPSADGSVRVVDNRIVRIEHNGQTHELISSPRYDRIQKSIVTNLMAVVICGLVIAILMTLLNG